MKITSMFPRIMTAITGIMSITPSWIHKTWSAALLTLIWCIASAATAFADNPYLLRTFEENGSLIDEVIVPPSPPGHQNASRSGARTRFGSWCQHTQ